MSKIDWPTGFDRTDPTNRSTINKYQTTLGQTTQELAGEMERLDPDDWRASTGSGGAYTKKKGLPKSKANPDDPGFVVRWSKDGQQFAVASDASPRLRDNVRTVYLWIRETRLRNDRPVETGEDEFAAARLPPADEDADVVVAGLGPRDAAEVLGVQPDAPEAVVETAYREKVQEVHPDKPDGDEAAFKQVKEAKRVILGE